MIPFEKYSGCGNDFIIIDNRESIVTNLLSKSSIQQWCHRHHGIGADGIVLLEKSLISDFRMRIFNADGSEAEMCGNGLRCLSLYIKNNEPKIGNHFIIETMHEQLKIEIENSKISVHMPNPTNLKQNIELAITHPQKKQTREITAHSINTGVPHVVIFVDNLAKTDLMEYAPYIRSHSLFGPNGTNVNFAMKISNDTFAIRTFERGVEGETEACGTGAVATALISFLNYQLPSSLNIQTKSQDLLVISFDSHLKNIKMSGPTKKIYQGEMISIESSSTF